MRAEPIAEPPAPDLVGRRYRNEVVEAFGHLLTLHGPPRPATTSAAFPWERFFVRLDRFRPLNARATASFCARNQYWTILASAETAAMLFWALLASGQITMRKVDGWPTLAEPPSAHAIDLAE